MTSSDDANDEAGTMGTADGTHRSVTIRDVAKAVGVSPSTVSRAFARPGRVSAETSQRIREAADRLGYRVKTVTSLNMTDSHHLSGLIAITVADLGNPIFADYVKSAQHECLRKGFGLLVIDFEETNLIERKALNLAMNHVDGLILSSSRSSDATIRKMAEIKPLIALNRPIRGVQSIIPDTMQGLEEALDHLIRLGHSEVTYLSGPEASWQDGRRWRTLSELCKKKQVRLRRIGAESPSYSGGYRYSEEFMRNPTTAVICYNDIVAIGFIKALQAKGIRIPEEVSVVGIDDTPVSSLVTPALSTIRLPRKEPAQLAVDEIVNQLRHARNGNGTPSTTFLKSTFIPRSSTAPASNDVHMFKMR
ncbi:LacI family DNA-binding transcriptional regulator [Bifidobacterium sp. SMB2]|uniref:LacI family DNA-binding transcriptional regulator n=1 Tax=Bifidobacterium saimiriisciurei TaxID=2661627 RepID=A0ABX0C9X7_9BIFI|nr:MULTISPECIES: LacI family DNA-binding transcriptional regulator [Bifidobacterium]NEG96354.1 LacI family DNA-binding transcriptional regulator [Bifidobacterium sp. SMB2]NEH11014.1 LacI family DNA-binding transcriptional regulator [Bifidobacterium saimiriisciurei]